jgi:uncharacterized FlgJ-related protein
VGEGNPYNCWGLGYYGESNEGFTFKSYEEAIRYLVATLTTHKAYEEFRQTKEIEDIATKYLTGDRDRWVSNVYVVMNILEKI